MKAKDNIQEKGKLSKRICENGQNMQLHVVEREKKKER